MMKSPAMWVVGMGTWLVSSLASINIGLDALGMGFVTLPWMDYVILFSGIFSLGMMVISLMYVCGCGVCKMCCEKNNACNNKNTQSKMQQSSGNMGGGHSGGNMCRCGKQMAQCGCGK